MSGLNALERLPPNLFIGRLSSFVMATRLAQWLREGRLSLTQARARLVHHEKSRLGRQFKHELRTVLPGSGRRPEPVANEIRVIAAEGFVQIALFPSLKMLGVNLPWGPALATIYGELLCPRFNRTMLVGGAGSRRRDLEPEQVFAAKWLAAEHEPRVSLQNILIPHVRALGVAAFHGTLRSTHGSIPSPEARPHLLPASDVVDMETAYILRFASSQLGCLHYIMDSSETDFGLSDTYYNPAWLSWLAGKSTRAKNLCYAAVLRQCGEAGAEALVEL
jgi:hypothetical protein